VAHSGTISTSRSTRDRPASVTRALAFGQSRPTTKWSDVPGSAQSRCYTDRVFRSACSRVASRHRLRVSASAAHVRGSVRPFRRPCPQRSRKSASSPAEAMPPA